MKTVEDIKEYLAEIEAIDTEFFTNPDYASAIVGITDDNRLVYNYTLMIRHLVDTCDISEEDAREDVDANTLCALEYMGEKKPIIVYELPI